MKGPPHPALLTAALARPQDTAGEACALLNLGNCHSSPLPHPCLTLASPLPHPCPQDTAGEACALLNLSNCHSSRGEFAHALPYYEQYLMLSQELHDTEGEARACHFLGYAHYCLGNFKEAIR